MDRNERRKSRRLGARFNLSYRQVGTTTKRARTGKTVNVATGGLYFETLDEILTPGSLLEVELSIPPERGVLEFGGRISGFAKILRADIISEGDSSTNKQGIAVQFCKAPSLCL
jgi:hypothetical protein